MHLPIPHLASALGRLDDELSLWADVGRPCQLWWRDDDARGPTPEFARLMLLSNRYEVPLLAGVVPTTEAAGLKDVLAPKVWVAQHGVDHRNHVRAGRPNQFTRTQSKEEIRELLLEVKARLDLLPRRLPIYIPPWNTITPALVPAAAGAGFTVMSAFGRALRQTGPLLRADTHVDILRWAPRAKFHGVSYCLHRLTRHMRRRRRSGHWSQPIGLLSHHLVHDQQMWSFLEDFLVHTSARRGISWVSPEAFPRIERQEVRGADAIGEVVAAAATTR